MGGFPPVVSTALLYSLCRLAHIYIIMYRGLLHSAHRAGGITRVVMGTMVKTQAIFAQAV
jgi:hypothetical protein